MTEERRGAWYPTSGWRPWFAWYPTRMNPWAREPSNWTWLRKVEYRVWEMGSSSDTWDFLYEYRYPDQG